MPFGGKSIGTRVVGSLKREQKLLKTEVTLLRDMLVAGKGAAEKCKLLEAMGEVKEGVVLQLQKW